MSQVFFQGELISSIFEITVNFEESIDTPTLIETINFEDTTVMYVFQIFPKGFVIISADDKILPVLAYSFNNYFKIENIPSNIASFLNEYKGRQFNSFFVFLQSSL